MWALADEYDDFVIEMADIDCEWDVDDCDDDVDFEDVINFDLKMVAVVVVRNQSEIHENYAN